MPIIKGINYIIRLGSTTDVNDTKSKGGNRIEINSIEGIKNSSNKLKMKQCFNNAEVKTAIWWKPVIVHGSLLCYPNGNENHSIDDDFKDETNLPYPIVVKHIFGSRGKGNTLINSKEELNEWLKNKQLSNYIFEKFYNYNREYRLHVTKNGCFYTCRKVLKNDTPIEKRWSRHDDNCNWILEENPLFDKPNTWNSIVEDCKKALIYLKLDVAAFDVKVQSSKNKKGEIRENADWIILESNSAPSHGNITTIKYIEELTKLIKQKNEFN